MSEELKRLFDAHVDMLDEIAYKISNESIFNNIQKEIKRQERERLYKATRIIDVEAVEIIPEERRLR